MSEKEKEYKYEGHVHAKTKIMDFDEFNKRVKETNGKHVFATEKDGFFGMKKIKGLKTFSANNPYFYQAVKIDDDKEGDDHDGDDNDTPPPAADVQTPAAGPAIATI